MVAQGRAPAALRALERSLSSPNWAHRQRRGFLLAGLVDVAVAAGETDRAREALKELEDTLQNAQPSALVATALQARASLLAHDDDLPGAIDALCESTRRWSQVGSPLQVARNRLRLAELHLQDKDPEGAELELSAVRSLLERIGAPNLLDRAEQLAKQISYHLE
jgi:hypothetical protein